MDDNTNVSCVLCRLSKETEITGSLLTKDEVTAHQNCLLFSSGIICQSTPQHDDLFGFSVEDVLGEVQRGKRLVCKRCTKSGATAGCEVKRCKRSYHYPCAVKDKAIIIEDTKEEKYVLYCPKHDPKAQENNGSVNGRPSSHTKSWTSKTPSEPRSAKVLLDECFYRIHLRQTT
ncbi:PHD finger protein 6-like [Epinephelus moara]|uniref:PHD finger protein 6-like n=1 Tax=Epinephelus moara TaxID=300413 RepID=UPI00214E2F94|nr:PHD finger protein 6-like [Epinephelus moara]